MKRKVLVYKHDILPISETFIREQVSSYKRWHGVLAGMRYVSEANLEGIQTRLLREARPNLLLSIENVIRRLSGTLSRSVIACIAQERPNIIHAHSGFSGVEIWPAARSLNLPLVVTFHGSDITLDPAWWRSGRGGASMRLYPRRLLQLATAKNVHFIAVSEAVCEAAIKFGIEPSKLTVKYVGINTKKFTPGKTKVSQRSRRVLYIGRLIECKGCEHLIRAFAKVKLLIPDAELVVVGDGPLRGKLEAEGQRLNLTANFLGQLRSDSIRAQIHEARVVCLPSISLPNGQAEGFGLVLLEAQASAVPVVAYCTGGIPEAMASERTGFLIGQGDENQLAQKLALILSDDNLAEAMSTAAPLFVARHFDMEGCTSKLESFYDAVLASATRSH